MDTEGPVRGKGGDGVRLFKLVDSNAAIGRAR